LLVQLIAWCGAAVCLVCLQKDIVGNMRADCALLLAAQLLLVATADLHVQLTFGIDCSS
jgi:hypothetical protein